MKLVNISSNKNTINLFIRDERGNLSIQPYNDYFPYFYEPSENGTFRSFTGVKLEKIVCKKPGELNRRRTDNSWESDVLLTKRFLIEKVPIIEKTNIKYFFIDIEVLTTKGLPNYQNPENIVVCIGLYNSFTKNIHTWFINDYEGNIDQQEKLLLNNFIQYMQQEKPDLLIGWNIKNFDYPYLYNRIKKLYNSNFAELISPIKQSCYAGKKEAEENIWNPAGISIVDYLGLYKKFTLNRKQSYALEDVAQLELKKLPRIKVDFSVLNDDVQNKNYEDIVYMVELEEQKKLIPYYDEIRRLSKCLWEDLLMNSKVVDQLALQEAKNQNVVLPREKYKEDYEENDDEKKFEGAYRRCETGLFKNLYEVDLSSAYPAAIIEFCLDIANIRETSNANTLLIPITDRETCEIKETVIFEQNKTAILPSIAKKALVLKDKLKKELKSLNPELQEYKDLEVKYSSIKGIVNSIFGVNALKSFRLFDIRVASAITSLIRDLLHYVELKAKELGIDTIYTDTDSVAEDSPIMIKQNNIVSIVPIEDISQAPLNSSKILHDIYKKNIEIWTDLGWSRIKYIYKHKTKKQMFRILTRKGYIEVSEDHSLVINNISIKPSQLKIGDYIELILTKLPEENLIDSDLAWLLGFWLAEGSVGIYTYNNRKKHCWTLSQNKKKPLLKAQRILLKYGFQTNLLNTMNSSNCYKLVAVNNPKAICELFLHWCITKTGNKKIPNLILNSKKNSKKRFLSGYLLGDGSVGKKDKIISFCSIDKSLFSGICQIIQDLGFEYSLSIRNDKPNVLTARIIRNDKDLRIRKSNEIIKIEKFLLHDYIYDIETENHHFCGGIGNINLHNSMLYKSDKNQIELLNQLIQQWAKEKYNKDSIGIVFDNKGVIDKIFILAMCHYKALKGKEEVVRGIESRKKDSSDYIKYFQPELIDKVMNEEPKEKIVEWIKSEIEKFNNLSPLEIAFPAKLAHEIEDYKTTSVRKSKDSEGKIIKKTFKKEVPIHVRAYRNAKELGLTKEVADNFLWLYLKSEDKLKNAMAFDSDNLHLVKKEDIDYPKMLGRNILNKVKNIFIALKWENPFIDKKIKTRKTIAEMVESIAEMVESAETTKFGVNLRQKQPKIGVKTEISDKETLEALFKGGLLK
ncbi:MAG: 3'-5' exonuclease [Patescibacteria group bacterium]